ncbi:MAG TPA: nucleoside triphosphate pyrophosphohydrolase [Clostridia bacterium]|nr:nucleoside triphosphate pyrophosphohydrolase [Clostridia bacterium]
MKLIVAALSTPGSISCAAEAAVKNANKLFLQTAHHPSAAWIVRAGLSFESMDDLYAEAEDFDALNSAIADRLARSGADAIYAVPGRGVGAALKAKLLKACGEREIELTLLPGIGYAEAALAMAPAVSSGDVRIVEASALPLPLDPYVTLCVEEIDTPLRAREVKLALTEYFPDEHPAYFCHMDAQGSYSVSPIPLYELDRQNAYFAADALVVPAASFERLSRHGLEGLTGVMERLRAPGGCPWDAEQTHESLKKSLVEETYEVLDAIERNDMDALCEELGDLLLQVVFHAQLEAELRSFTMRDVTTGIVNKLVYRHPHVFGDVSVSGSAEVLVNWDQLKKKEKRQDTVSEAMESVPRGFPALMRAQKLQKKAATVGFDWPDASGALDKLAEEADELRTAVGGEGEARVFEEAGDLLFSAVNAARLAGCDAELALREACDKFLKRFTELERDVTADGLELSKLGIDALNLRWERIKKAK